MSPKGPSTKGKRNQAARNLPTPTYREVYRAIAAYANEEGIAQPTEQQIALEAGVSTRTVQNVYPDLVRLGYLRLTQEPITEGPNKGVPHNVYHIPLAKDDWQPPPLLPIEEASKPITKRLLEQKDRIIEERDRVIGTLAEHNDAQARRIAELEALLGLPPAEIASKGSSSQGISILANDSNDYDYVNRRAQNLRPSISVPTGADGENGHPSTATAEGTEETDAGTSSRQGWRQHPRYEEVKAWVDSMWKEVRAKPDRPRGWKGNRDQAIRWYLDDHLEDFERQREDLKPQAGSDEGWGGRVRKVQGEESDPEAEALWEKVKADLALQVSSSVYKTWIGGTTGHRFENELLLVTTGTMFSIEWLERRMYQTIVANIRRVVGDSADVKFVVADEGGG